MFIRIELGAACLLLSHYAYLIVITTPQARNNMDGTARALHHLESNMALKAPILKRFSVSIAAHHLFLVSDDTTTRKPSSTQINTNSTKMKTFAAKALQDNTRQCLI